MAGRDFQVYGLGQGCMDYIGKVAAYPVPDTKCEISDMVIQGGGPVATALVALTRWGVGCAFAGVLGDDLFGGRRTAIGRDTDSQPRRTLFELRQDSFGARGAGKEIPGSSEVPYIPFAKIHLAFKAIERMQKRYKKTELKLAKVVGDYHDLSLEIVEK